jgi:hypothetical protein
MSLDKILLSTTLGDALVRGSDRVYIKIHSNQFIRKEARYVEEGESALWHKRKTRTEFSDIEPFLIYSPRYRHSLDFIKEQNDQGEYINRLRALLIRGLAKQGVVSSENLENRILNNYDGRDRPLDFGDWEIEAMAKYLVDFMESQKDPISLRQARSWLRGETVAPQNWDHFRTFQRLNPEFKDWRKHEQERDSRYFNYRLHIVVRQQIQRKLLEYLGKTWGGGGEDYETFITVNPEYRLIIDHFLDEHTDVLRNPEDFDDELVFARVNEKTRVRKQKQEAAIRENDKLLTEGLYVKRHPLLDTTAMSYGEVVEHKRAVDRLLEAIIEEYLLEFYFTPDIGADRELNNLLDQRRKYLVNKLKLEYGTKSPSDPLYEVYTRVKGEESQMVVADLYGNFSKAMFSGVVDEQFGLLHGTFMRMIEIAFKLDLGVPLEVKRYVYDMHKFYQESLEAMALNRGADGEALKRLVRDRKRILSRFDINVDYAGQILSPRIFFSDIVLEREIGV